MADGGQRSIRDKSRTREKSRDRSRVRDSSQVRDKSRDRREERGHKKSNTLSVDPYAGGSGSRSRSKSRPASPSRKSPGGETADRNVGGGNFGTAYMSTSSYGATVQGYGDFI